jgi:hypothetical protein
MNVYIVMGTTGEPFTKSEWPVIVYKDKEKAKKHARMATEKADSIYKILHINFDKLPENPYDPNMLMDYTGTHYFIRESILVEDNIND